MRQKFVVWESSFMVISLMLSLVGSELQVSRKLSKDFATSERTMVVLQSGDGGLFEVEAAAALQSQAIRRMVEDGCGHIIPLPNVTSDILSKVIEYSKHHAEAAAADQDQLNKFDAGFVRVDHSTLFGLILAADYLEIKSLLDLASGTVADMIKGKTPGEIRKMFNITNCFPTNSTLEEQEFESEFRSMF